MAEFDFSTEAFIAAGYNHPPQPGEYHWKKIAVLYEPSVIETVITTSKELTIVQKSVDLDGDVVAFFVSCPNMAIVRNLFRHNLGKEHGLMIAEQSSSRSVRAATLQKASGRKGLERYL